MNRIIEEYISLRQLDATTLARLSQATSAEEEVFAGIIEYLQPSRNSLGEILRLADEVSSRDGHGWTEIFTSAAVERIYQHGGSKKQKQKLLLNYLESLRYPFKARLTQVVEATSSELCKDYGFRLSLPSELEGDRIELTVSFRSPEQLAQQAERLSQMAEQPRLELLFRLLKGEEVFE